MLKTWSCQLTDLNTTFLSVFKKARRPNDAVFNVTVQKAHWKPVFTDDSLKASICARAAFGSKRHRRFCRAFLDLPLQNRTPTPRQIDAAAKRLNSLGER